jgi:hypothetical protein
MPKLSLYRQNKQNDYRFFDRTISEQLTVGGTDLYIHKYLGPTNQGPSIDYTQPDYANLSPTNIQDLLFLENRDRTYDDNIYRLRGHYNVQNLDFDLSQFGLFLNNDILFITVHYNDMIDIIGRKLMVGDVIELPHLLDYNPLKETIPVALKRFYQITDANFASEGFSQTWFPHLWRIKCEKLVNSQEFSQILQQPVETDNFLGTWDSTKTYPAGYTVTFGDKNYISIAEVPAGESPPNATYWALDTGETLSDILSTYNTNISINNAQLEEANRIVPLSGYNNTNLYVVPIYGEWETNTQLSGKIGQPAPPINLTISSDGPPGVVMMMHNPKYKKPSPAIKVPKQTFKNIYDMTVDMDISDKLDKFVHAALKIAVQPPERIGSNSGAVEGTYMISVRSLGAITGPYGTADNTFATADQDPTAPGFTGTITPQMDFRADADPAFQFISRYSPLNFNYTQGYLTGDGNAPNGFPVGTGLSFPQNPEVGDYFLRIDYKPNILYRWSGRLWVKISENVRTPTGYSYESKNLLSTFINNRDQVTLTDGSTIPSRQALSTILTQPFDPIPPVT